MTDKEKITLLTEALTAAKEHLEYCNYGDHWERECAQASNLSQKIEHALTETGKQ